MLYASSPGRTRSAKAQLMLGHYISALAPHMDRVFVLEPSLGIDGLVSSPHSSLAFSMI